MNQKVKDILKGIYRAPIWFIAAVFLWPAFVTTWVGELVDADQQDIIISQWVWNVLYIVALIFTLLWLIIS
jgi:hypothetical protein